MKPNWIAAALGALAALAAHAAGVGGSFPQPFGVLQWEKSPYTDEYKQLAADGAAALKRGEAGKGIELLTKAAMLPLAAERPGAEPAPNFELWDG